MMSLTTMGLNLDPLVRTILPLFICVLKIPLVVNMAWGLEFLYQQESIPNVIIFAFVVFVPTFPKVVDSSKCFGDQITYFLSKLETQFYSYSHGLTLPQSLQLL